MSVPYIICNMLLFPQSNFFSGISFNRKNVEPIPVGSVTNLRYLLTIMKKEQEEEEKSTGINKEIHYILGVCIISIANAAHIQQMTCTHTYTQKYRQSTVMPKCSNSNTWHKLPAWKKRHLQFPIYSIKNDFILDSKDEKKESENEINAHFKQRLILMSCISIVCAANRGPRYHSIPYEIHWYFAYEMALFAFPSHIR